MPIRKKGTGVTNSNRRASETEVLAGIRRVIARRGVEETRFSDVAAETGTALSTLQYRFGNWEGMILAALRHENRCELERVSRAAEDADGPAEGLRAMLLAATWADASPGEAREGSLVWAESWRVAARDSDLAVEWRLIHDQWRDLVEEIVIAGERAGEMTPPHGSRAAALQLVALLDGFSVPLVLETPDATPAAVGRLSLEAASLIVGCPQLCARESV